jgi:hypothetical protein
MRGSLRSLLVGKRELPVFLPHRAGACTSAAGKKRAISRQDLEHVLARHYLDRSP